MRVAHLSRRPLAEGSVGRNVLEHGTGGINIDASRMFCGTDHFIRSSSPRKSGGMVAGGSDERKGAALGMFCPGATFEPTNHPGGRWPSNIVLVHRPKCQRTGTKKVQSQLAILRNETVPIGYGGNMTRKPQQLGHADPDGTETVEAWSCAPGCPVVELDGQSGNRKTTWVSQTHQNNRQGDFLGELGHPGDQGYNDSGGVSRFFKQVQENDMTQPLPQDLIDYFSTMISPPGKPAYVIEDVSHTAVWTDLASKPDASLGGIIAAGTPTEAQAKELMRVLLPGAHLILVAPEEETTGHTGACRIEDAGFEIRDAILLADQAEGIHYVPKASRGEREAGCDHLEAKTGAEATDREAGTAGLNSPRAGAGRTAEQVRNPHPTVKPLHLMERLLADIPTGQGAVLDPFLGSGTTAVAGVNTGHSVIGIEREGDYLKISDARVRHAVRWGNGGEARRRGVEIKSDAPPVVIAPKDMSNLMDAFGFGGEDE